VTPEVALRPLLTKTEAAALLRVSSRTLERLVARNELEPVRLGGRPRFRYSDVEALVGPKRDELEWR
jgi:excisionase family DNA binding protein